MTTAEQRMTRSYRTGRHWSADGLDLHAGPVEGCPECAGNPHRTKGE